jgi:hypothetical protein
LSWTWLAVGLFVLLALAFVVRERFTTYEEALRDVGQTAGYITPSCPDGFTMNSERTSCEKPNPDGTKETADPACPSGSRYVKRGSQGQCEKDPSSPSEDAASSPSTESVSPSEDAASSPSTESAAPVPGSSGTGADTASSTGGSSGTRFGPNSAPKGGRNVWGPVFKGLGEGDGPVGGDSTKTNPYPALMGGMGGRASTRIEGVGIVPPSGVGLGGVMPSSSALGTDANSRFLPYSRQPGDMDVVADPYRLASNFSASSYSASKTDPVPFLTDFSAFYR